MALLLTMLWGKLNRPVVGLGVLRVFWVDVNFVCLDCPKRRYPNDRGVFGVILVLGFEFTWGFWFGICIPEWFI